MTELEENFHYFGIPLDLYDEDAFPKKKPISLDDQVATDSQGRRRFHGAFTGGFSAGFFNTVGSLEGWTPSEFKSTRQDKAKNCAQRPEDFMDEEDFGEYGIAHQSVRATNEFSTVKKRKRQIFTNGPIPGEPVLQTLLTRGNETVGYLLLKNIGIQDKILKQQEETIYTQETKTYGCEMPSEYKIPKNIENKQYKIPIIYKGFMKNPKSNTAGLGYQGLDKSHINLFQSSDLVMKDKNNRKIAIHGQAFGVGAFEEDDEDIYVKEDMSKYDFELTNENRFNKQEINRADLLFEMFKKLNVPLLYKKRYPLPNIPHSFTGKHNVKRSRFEPIYEESGAIEQNKINPEIRAKYLGEPTNKTCSPSKAIALENNSKGNVAEDNNSTQKSFEISSILISDRFVSSSQKEDVGNILEPVHNCKTTHGTEELREATRMKMFGQLTRVTTDWQPCSILCKRFNVPEPILDRLQENVRKKTKNIIFDYQKHQEFDGDIKPGLSIKTTEDVQDTNIKNLTETSNTAVNELVLENKQDVAFFSENNDLVLQGAPKDITEKINVAEKLDLFKAVFLSSSESEDEDNSKQEENEIQRTEEHKASVLSEQLLIPKLKPIKEGLLSNVNFHEFKKTSNISQETNSTLEQKNSQGTYSSFNLSDNKDELSYGPKLPIQKHDTYNISKMNIISSGSEDEWVEAHETNKRKKNKHKREHHKKAKHKKHKCDKKIKKY